MLTTFNDHSDLLEKVITGDESQAYGHDIETNAQSSQWKRLEEPRTKKAHQVQLNMKVLLTVFFDCNGLVHHEFEIGPVGKICWGQDSYLQNK